MLAEREKKDLKKHYTEYVLRGVAQLKKEKKRKQL